MLFEPCCTQSLPYLIYCLTGSHCETLQCPFLTCDLFCPKIFFHFSKLPRMSSSLDRIIPGMSLILPWSLHVQAFCSVLLPPGSPVHPQSWPRMVFGGVGWLFFVFVWLWFFVFFFFFFGFVWFWGCLPFTLMPAGDLRLFRFASPPRHLSYSWQRRSDSVVHASLECDGTSLFPPLFRATPSFPLSAAVPMGSMPHCGFCVSSRPLLRDLPRVMYKASRGFPHFRGSSSSPCSPGPGLFPPLESPLLGPPVLRHGMRRRSSGIIRSFSRALILPRSPKKPLFPNSLPGSKGSANAKCSKLPGPEQGLPPPSIFGTNIGKNTSDGESCQTILFR